jgi:anti-sigma B factor antagonist
MEMNSVQSGSVRVLQLAGRFDAYETPKVTTWLDGNLKPDDARIVVNLKGVNFVDSTALSTLVQAMKRARQNQGDCRLCEVQQPVRIILELTRLDKAFEIYSDEAAAARSFAD